MQNTWTKKAKDFKISTYLILNTNTLRNYLKYFVKVLFSKVFKIRIWVGTRVKVIKYFSSSTLQDWLNYS